MSWIFQHEHLEYLQQQPSITRGLCSSVALLKAIHWPQEATWLPMPRVPGWDGCRQLLRPGLGPVARSPSSRARQLQPWGSRGPSVPRQQQVLQRPVWKTLGKNKIEGKYTWARNEMLASDIRGRARRSGSPLGVWANCTLVSRNILLTSIAAPQGPRKTFLWSAPPCSTPSHPSAMFWRERFSIDFQKGLMLFLSHSHLNSPVTDIIVIASGKAESLVCVEQKPSSAPLIHMCKRLASSCLYSQCWTWY